MTGNRGETFNRETNAVGQKVSVSSVLFESKYWCLCLSVKFLDFSLFLSVKQDVIIFVLQRVDLLPRRSR